MKAIFCIILFIQFFAVSAQLQGNYNNPKLKIPNWLTNPDYVSDTETEEKDVDIEEIELATVDKISVMELRLYESEHNASSTSIYLGTFDSKMQILDIVDVANLSSSDWNWQGELSFEEIEPAIIKYYCVELTYRPAESGEEQEASGGMILSSGDTIITFFHIDNEGIILFSEDLDDLKNMINPNNKLEPEELIENTDFDEESCILNIRKVFTEINQNSSLYKKETKKSGNNINLTYFYDGNSLKKISEMNVSNDQSIEYYLDNNYLVFIYTFNKSKKTESRYYFNRNKMFRWLKGSEKQAIDKNSIVFKEKESELLSRYKYLTIN